MDGLPDRGEHVVADVALVADPKIRVHRNQDVGFFQGEGVVA